MGEPAQVLRREGDYWTIVFDQQLVRLRDSKGLRYLAVLLRHPGRKVAATDLVAAVAGGRGSEEGNGRNEPAAPSRPAARDRQVERARVTVTKGIKSALERIAAAHPSLGTHLAATVRRGYACAYTPDPRQPLSWEE